MKHTRREFVVLAGAAAATTAAIAAEPKRPNVLFLFTDQQRWDTIAAAGFDHMITPNLDELVRNGVLFNQAYTPFPLCTPARASIVTGCYARRHHVFVNGSWFNDNADTWPQMFTDAGYDTRAIGKMHPAPFANPLGFQKRVIAEDKYCVHLPDDYQAYMKSQGLRRPNPWEDPGKETYVRTGGAMVFPYDEKCHIDAFVGRAAVDALQETAQTGRPFCHWVSFNSPHAPHDPPQRLLDLYKDRKVPKAVRRPGEPFDKPASRLAMMHFLEEAIGLGGNLHAWTDEQIQERRRYYYATITFVDEWIGKIIQTLKDTGQYDNTLILFASDHGDAQGDHNLVEKTFFYEGMVRVPLFFHWPRKFGPGVSDEFVSLVDIAPTLLAQAGLPIPERVDGQDLTPLLTGRGNWKSRDAVFSENRLMTGPMTMVRTRKWKYVHDPEPSCCELYDLENDPDEFYNVYHDPKNARVRRKLQKRIEQWRANGPPFFTGKDMLPGDYAPVR